MKKRGIFALKKYFYISVLIFTFFVFAYFVNDKFLGTPNNNVTNWPDFSCEKYKNERNVIAKIYGKDFKDIESGLEGMPHYVKVPIALVDINGDRVNEIFVGLQHPFYTGGQWNTMLMIFQYKKGKPQYLTTFGSVNLFIDKNEKQKNLSITESKSKWKDIIINERKFSWNGMEYEFVGQSNN